MLTSSWANNLSEKNILPNNKEGSLPGGRTPHPTDSWTDQNEETNTICGWLFTATGKSEAHQQWLILSCVIIQAAGKNLNIYLVVFFSSSNDLCIRITTQHLYSAVNKGFFCIFINLTFQIISQILIFKDKKAQWAELVTLDSYSFKF